MNISVFDMYSIGIGPSSSHTVGPMRAAKKFLEQYAEKHIHNIHKIKVDLYGSLALTGKGHSTDKAILLGLSGHEPETVPEDEIDNIISNIYSCNKLNLNFSHNIKFTPNEDMEFHYDEFLPQHPNGMRISAYNSDNNLLVSNEVFSTGGGFIQFADEIEKDESHYARKTDFGKEIIDLPYPFNCGDDLLKISQRKNISIYNIITTNEMVYRDKDDIYRKLDHIWQVMDASISRGCNHIEDTLPGGLNVRRRAPKLYNKLSNISGNITYDMNWLNLFALAVNEENAAGQKVVTAPTNGSAGIIPAIMKFYLCTNPMIDQQKSIREFLVTAGAIGMLYKKNASISAAEVGCQGEIGVASSMSAAGLCALYGGNVYQIERAAEMAMEYHLGLTCDPVKGLVQVPCIERNAMGAMTAFNSAKLAMLEDATGHLVSLDDVIETMYKTGKDMSHNYKETSKAGLAKNLSFC